MSKYDKLKEDSDNTIIGVKFTKRFFESILYKGKLKTIQGFPPCPECGEVLDKVWYAPGGWKCNHCNTTWSTLDLVTAIENEKEATDGTANTRDDGC